MCGASLTATHYMISARRVLDIRHRPRHGSAMGLWSLPLSLLPQSLRRCMCQRAVYEVLASSCLGLFELLLLAVGTYAFLPTAWGVRHLLTFELYAGKYVVG